MAEFAENTKTLHVVALMCTESRGRCQDRRRKLPAHVSTMKLYRLYDDGDLRRDYITGAYNPNNRYEAIYKIPSETVTVTNTMSWPSRRASPPELPRRWQVPGLTRKRVPVPVSTPTSAMNYL